MIGIYRGIIKLLALKWLVPEISMFVPPLLQKGSLKRKGYCSCKSLCFEGNFVQEVVTLSFNSWSILIFWKFLEITQAFLHVQFENFQDLENLLIMNYAKKSCLAESQLQLLHLCILVHLSTHSNLPCLAIWLIFCCWGNLIVTPMEYNGFNWTALS